eukprot:324219-Prymnesium_polylepis.1
MLLAAALNDEAARGGSAAPFVFDGGAPVDAAYASLGSLPQWVDARRGGAHPDADGGGSVRSSLRSSTRSTAMSTAISGRS